jgi:CRP-like cAMP-binding protein
VAELKDGSFIGEISFIRGGDATATVKVVEPTRYLSWTKESLSQMLNRNPSMRSAMQAVLSTDLTKKLVRQT